MQLADQGQPAAEDLDGSDLHIGIVQARFNADITERMATVCIAELRRLGVDVELIEHVTVPGALEIPVALMAMADSDDFDALIAIGCIVRGETYHFELVANESAAGLTRVSLDHQLPVANAILTVEDDAQAWERAETKARDAARVAIEMARLLEDLS